MVIFRIFWEMFENFFIYWKGEVLKIHIIFFKNYNYTILIYSKKGCVIEKTVNLRSGKGDKKKEKRNLVLRGTTICAYHFMAY